MRRVKVKKFAREKMEKIPGFVYCGRAAYGYRRSPLANPYKVGIDGTVEGCITLYRGWLWERVDAGDRAILDALGALTEDSVLGCWCAPKPCHCDVIAEVWAALHAGAAS
jgi:hypothetical protein